MSVLTRWSPPGTVDYFRDRMHHSPLARRLASGAAWSLMGAVATRVLTLASSIIVVRILGRETLGEFGMVQSTLAMLGTFAGLGLGMTATKYIAEFRSKDPAKVGRIVGLILIAGVISGMAMTAAGWIGSEWLAGRILERQSLAPYLRMSAFLLVIGVVDGVLSSALAGFEAFGRLARISIYIAVINVLCTVPLVYWFHIYGAVTAMIITTSLHVMLAAHAVRDECRRYGIKMSVDRLLWDEWPVLVHYALPALAASILFTPATWLANVLLVRTPDGYEEMGALKVVDTLRNIAMYLPTVLLSPIFAVLSNVADDPKAVRRTMRYGLGVSALAVLPAGLVVAAMAKFILGLYGPAFTGEGMVLACAMIVVGVQAMGVSLGNYVSATGRMWFGLGVNLLWAAAFLGIAVVLMPRYGALGYMAAMALSYLIGVVVVYVFLASKLPDVMRCYPLCRALALFTVLMLLAIYIDQNFNFIYSAGSALLLGAGMAGMLVIPLTRWWDNHW